MDVQRYCIYQIILSNDLSINANKTTQIYFYLLYRRIGFIFGFFLYYLMEILNDTHFMRYALQEARLAYAADEVPVGAVLVCRNQIIAKAHNQTLCDVRCRTKLGTIGKIGVRSYRRKKRLQVYSSAFAAPQNGGYRRRAARRLCGFVAGFFQTKTELIAHFTVFIYRKHTYLLLSAMLKDTLPQKINL